VLSFSATAVALRWNQPSFQCRPYTDFSYRQRWYCRPYRPRPKKTTNYVTYIRPFSRVVHYKLRLEHPLKNIPCCNEGRSQDFWFGGLILAEVSEALPKQKKCPPASGSFFQNKSSNKHMPKPKRANGLHFVWGAIFLFGGSSAPKQAHAWLRPWLYSASLKFEADGDVFSEWLGLLRYNLSYQTVLTRGQYYIIHSF